MLVVVVKARSVAVVETPAGVLKIPVKSVVRRAHVEQLQVECMLTERFASSHADGRVRCNGCFGLAAAEFG